MTSTPSSTPSAESADRIRNGMPALSLGRDGWECPWSGTNGGNCLETKHLADGRVAVRQSTDPSGPALVFTAAEFTAFVNGAKSGLADHLATA